MGGEIWGGHPDTARVSPVTAPRVRSRAAGGGEEEEEAGAASGAELQQRRLLCCGRGAPEVREPGPVVGGGGQGWVRVLGSGCRGRVGMQMWRGGGGCSGDAEAVGCRNCGSGPDACGDGKERNGEEGRRGPGWK